MGGERDSTAAKVNETVRSHAANATDACTKLRDTTVATASKVKETVAVASEYLSNPKSRENLSKFAVNASINAAKFIPGGVGTAIDIVSQSIPGNKKKNDDDDECIKRIEALEEEVKQLRQKKKELKHSATSKL